MKIRFQVDGGDKLAATLRQVSKRLSTQILSKALLEAGEPMRAAAEGFAPRAPGAPDIADNIRIAPQSTSRSKATKGDVPVAIGPTEGFFYGHYQEYGTSRHGAQPFMRPAFDQEARATVQRMSGLVWHALIARGFGSTRGGGGSGGLT